jgi:putative endonuclease
MFFIYILESEVNGSYYIGQTNNLEDRLKRHNQLRNRSTKANAPWKLLHFEVYEKRSEAMKVESYLKKLKKRSLVQKWVEDQHRGVAQPG